jgi:hypothetical protein
MVRCVKQRARRAALLEFITSVEIAYSGKSE